MSGCPGLDQAIALGDVDAARIAIRAIADGDISRETPQAVIRADAAERAFCQQGKHLYEPDNGHFVMPPEGEWSEKLLYTVKGSLDWNFSRERLLHLQNLNTWLRKKREDDARPFASARVMNTENPRSSRKCQRKWIVYGIVGAVIVVSIGAIVIGIASRSR